MAILTTAIYGTVNGWGISGYCRVIVNDVTTDINEGLIDIA